MEWHQYLKDNNLDNRTFSGLGDQAKKSYFDTWKTQNVNTSATNAATPSLARLGMVNPDPRDMDFINGIDKANQSTGITPTLPEVKLPSVDSTYGSLYDGTKVTDEYYDAAEKSIDALKDTNKKDSTGFLGVGNEGWGNILKGGGLALAFAGYQDQKKTNKLAREGMRQDIDNAKTEAAALAKYRAAYSA